ncbi:MAG: GNAT family N-acetyltransferase [Erysipelotrichales bacterium]
MLINKKATNKDYELVLEIWYKSIKATHIFLKEEDIIFFRNEIPKFLGYVDLLLWYDEEQIIGFSGTKEDELEMLFLDPSYIGMQYGSRILQWLIANKSITKIGVNEANTNAYKFYNKHGFTIVSRSDLDGFGKPYPILHLEYK